MSNWYTNFQKSAYDAATALGQKVSDTTSNVRNSALGQQASDAATALGQKVSDTTSNVRTSALGQQVSAVRQQVSAAPGVVKDNVSSTATALGKNVSLLHGQLSSAATNARETASGLLEILSDTATDMNSLTKFIKKFTLLSYKNAGSIYDLALACNDAERGYTNTNKLSVAIAKYFNDIICLISNDIITTDGTKNKILENILRNFKPTGCKEKTEGGKKRKTKKNRRKTRK